MPPQPHHQPNNHTWCKAILFGILVLMFSTVTTAQPSQKLPIDLSADHGEYDGNTGTATYTGNVVITQGDMKLTGDKVVIHTANGKVTSVEAWGNLATFHYQPSKDPAIDGAGKHLKYNVPAATVSITGNARVKQAKNETQGDTLTYNLNSDTVSGKRVKMSFLPAS